MGPGPVDIGEEDRDECCDGPGGEEPPSWTADSREGEECDEVNVEAAAWLAPPPPPLPPPLPTPLPPREVSMPSPLLPPA
jgi:hypothetical protein